MINKDAWDGKQYKKHSEVQFRSGVAVLDGYPFRGDEWVLDVGCGDGKTTAEIAARVPRGHVIGIDFSLNMIQEANKAYGAIKNLEFYLLDAAKVYFDQKFDLVVSFFAMHWIENQKAALENMFKSLKPGGRVVMRMSGGNQPEIEQTYAQAPWNTLIKQQAWHGKTTQDYERMLEAAGFDDIDAKTELGTRVYPSFDALFNSIMVWVPYATGLPREQAQAFARDIANNIAEGQSNPDGSVVSSAPLALIEAVRPK